ncbi:hypothetical protein BO94DRAFT_624300 [Aspergillus sclerotioniger CBS 115572]|uniref:Tat pathway signal sequence n=1 Tax=Aspergillus sclerotioniger CBS 115572 TaxID=1450535 RepID=A0A317WPQ0_9EURO|nr:hypothetical protein BO94DRAFT_624300 [Aspergillus sclerotioniger CBS 115572]PWY87087.1 hypothetical protein BO94DRAFT_624300 [Aspergillus sclerotioniger CBS 115572]
MKHWIKDLVSQPQSSQLLTTTTTDDSFAITSNNQTYTPRKRTGTCFLLILAAMVVWLSGIVMGILLAQTNALRPNQAETAPTSTIPQMIITTHTTQKVQHNPAFEAPPPTGGGAEPYLIRRAYYAPHNPHSNPSSEEKASFDTGVDRPPHVGHCFDYLRQSLICTADSRLEPATQKANGNPTWGFERVCWDFEEVKNWAGKWKAYDISGSFVPFSVEDHHF